MGDTSAGGTGLWCSGTVGRTPGRWRGGSRQSGARCRTWCGVVARTSCDGAVLGGPGSRAWWLGGAGSSRLGQGLRSAPGRVTVGTAGPVADGASGAWLARPRADAARRGCLGVGQVSSGEKREGAEERGRGTRERSVGDWEQAVACRERRKMAWCGPHAERRKGNFLP